MPHRGRVSFVLAEPVIAIPVSCLRLSLQGTWGRVPRPQIPTLHDHANFRVAL